MKIASNIKKYIALAVIAAFMLGMLCACGSDASEEEATETKAKATVTAGEAAEKEAKDQADKDAAQKETTKRVKKGTEDPAIDAVKAAAYEDIKGFDGKWSNISVDVDDTVTTIEFDWNNNHYKYEYDQETKSILR